MSRKRRSALDDPSLWQRGEHDARRVYQSHADYVAHQSAKNDLPKFRRGLAGGDETHRQQFRRRFAGCDALSGMRAVLCLGARLGTEVMVLREMGHFAVGIDINPIKANAYVLPGDFHHLDFADGSVDAVYTNALDHALDIDQVIGEVTRVLCPGGVFIVDLMAGYDEGNYPGMYEAYWWRTRDALIGRIAAVGGFATGEPRPLDGSWCQVVFRKPG